MSTRNQVLKLYKMLLRESEKFESYNFRSYAVRRVKDAFRENQNLGNGNALREKISEGHKNLEIIKRQVLISQMYKTDRLIIENMARN
ncbi:LYR motif-containing protein bcn92 isoform X2 [Rhynchophorus ferrugineus]|uniref:LYR motif-containing protein bcn92 isoform X2 n=1 Tax=Rhynchophorus ferrugineus TaxID=354439 RepID=UPI003FCE60BA